MGNPRILIADNDAEIRQLIKLHLNNARMHVVVAASGREAVSILKHDSIDLVVLDLMMGNMNGWKLLQYMRSHQNQMNTPVIILSERDLEKDKIDAFEMGADDYVTKPFSPSELIARINALLRRSKPVDSGDTIRCGELVYDRAAQLLEKPSGTAFLSPIEGIMLEMFMRRPGHVFTKEEIFKNVWNLDQYDHNSLNVYISHLRKKVELDPSKPRYIQTVHGVGYRFVEESP